MKKIIFAGLLATSALCTQTYATAVWVKSHEAIPGLYVCIDRNSIVKDKQGITHFDSKFCANPHPGSEWHYAVDCSQDFSHSISLRQHFLPIGKGKNAIKDHWVNEVVGSNNGAFIDAKNACGK